MFEWLKNWYSVCISYATLWYITSAGTLLGKTELELGGINVIKDSAEILANSFNAIPSKSTAIALVGLIIVSQGIYLLGKGLVNIICSCTNRSLRIPGYADCLIGILFLACGIFLSLFCTNLSQLIFGL